MVAGMRYRIEIKKTDVSGASMTVEADTAELAVRGAMEKGMIYRGSQTEIQATTITSTEDLKLPAHLVVEGDPWENGTPEFVPPVAL